MSLIRLFIAVPLSKKQVAEVAILQSRLKHQLFGVRWIKPAGLHLTLHFLGESAEEKLTPIKTKMENLAGSHSRFAFNLQGSGVFPSPARAKILWLGLGQGAKELTALATKLQTELAALGFKPENRKYSPHLTIGRIRQPVAENLLKDMFLNNQAFKSQTTQAEYFDLMESRLQASGAEYSLIYRAYLAAP